MRTSCPRGFLGALDDMPFKLDVDKAKQLLAQGGYPDGFKISIDVPNGSPYLEMAQSIQATFAKAGVELQIIASDDKQQTSKIRSRKYQTAIGRWGPDYQDPHTNAQNFGMNVDNGENPPMKTTAWRTAWDIPELTKETEAAVLETDTAKRQAMYADLQRKIRDTAPLRLHVPAGRGGRRAQERPGPGLGPGHGERLLLAGQEGVGRPPGPAARPRRDPAYGRRGR